MKPRYLADADFNQRIVFGLRRREPTIDFQTARQGDVLGRPDPEVLSIAARENRILVSHDRATMPAHFAHFTAAQSSPGVLIVSQETDIGAVIEDLLLIWAASTLEEWREKIGFIPL
jgi:predicted nuclease of predicted toxin-antitoxin system